MRLNDHELAVIGPAIREVSKAESRRFFKRESNSQERSALVFSIIRFQISLALFDKGISLDKIVNDIDPTGTIVDRMLQDGYKIEDTTIDLIGKD